MAVNKRTFSTTIDPQVVDAFKEKCKEENINQSMLIETFMKAYVNGKVELRLVNNKIEDAVMKE